MARVPGAHPSLCHCAVSAPLTSAHTASPQPGGQVLAVSCKTFHSLQVQRMLSALCTAAKRKHYETQGQTIYL